MSCLFCSIAQKITPATIVYEDNEVVAFNDIAPKAPTHLLIVPKKHIESVNQIEEGDINLAGKLIYTAKLLAQKHGIAESGYKLVINCGSHGGQIVQHLHLHLLGGEPLRVLV
jgi:histidine triad (HIT) family protein